MNGSRVSEARYALEERAIDNTISPPGEALV